ncbi:MAG TPA: pyridoxamine 5'-phosphate oxidase [Blastocatellia bacterium]|nr:pyridoxamine 5'-phosphate oxidase [Blastocatellia bacterium]
MLELDSEYQLPELIESNIDPDPIKQFAKWYGEAEAAGVKLPNAMTLATATKDGEPSARMVLLKGFDDEGFVFFTNYESRKGRELDENPRAALVFYWSEFDRQVRIAGGIEKVSRAESEDYFHTRPVDSQLSAWASDQSRVISSREVLEEKMRELIVQYEGGEVPLPPHWGGYRLAPASIEFWQNRPGRLHDRLRYVLQQNGEWLVERLSP